MKVADVWRLIIFLTLGTLLGVLVGSTLLGLILFLLIYIWRLHSNLTTLENWINGANDSQASEQSGIFEDLTHSVNKLFRRHKKRRKRLTRVLRQFEDATRAWPDAIVILNQTDDIEWANPAARELLDIRWPEDKKQRLTNIVRFPKLREFISDPDNQNSKTVKIISPLKPDSYLSALMTPYSDTHKALTARNVTEIYKAIKARSDFVANVSHELKTPLTVFRGYLETLALQTNICPPTWEPAIKHMTDHAIEMSNLVDTLLDLSNLEEGQVVNDEKPVDVGALLQEIATTTSQLFKNKNHTINVALETSINLTGSRRELYSAFSNLMFNAAHYTAPNGVISARWQKNGSKILLEIEDNGIGISEEHISRVTERFYRVDNSRTRTDYGSKNGLGLAIVKHVVRRHKGTLNISSKMGSGSCFSIEFDAGGIAN